MGTPMTEPNLFDAERGEKLRDAGIERAAMNQRRKNVFEEAKIRAVAIAGHCGTVTIDDVMQEMERVGFDIGIIGPSAGAVFKGPQWEFTGQWVKSRRTSNHCRSIRVWRLKRG